MKNIKSNKQKETQFNEAQTIAMDRCERLINWYGKRQVKQRNRMARSRLVAIFLSGLVPVLVIIQMSLKTQTTLWLTMSVLIALFPAGSSILSAMNEIFQYKESWVRFSVAAEELRSEKVKYLTRTTKDYDLSLDNYKALSNFVSNIEAITAKEMRQWRAEAEKPEEFEELLQTLAKEA